MTTTLVATPEPLNDPPRVLLTLTWTAATTATVARQDPDGQTRVVRTADPATLSGGIWVGYDYESWFGESTVYTATVGATTITSSAVSLDVDTSWLRHPGIPSLSQPVELAGDGSPVRAATRAVLQPQGRQYPVVVSDGRRKAPASTLKLRTYELADKAALLALFDDVSVLLLDVPPALAWGITHQYMSFGDLTEDRLVVPRPDNPWREWSAPYNIVDRPPGGIQSQRTYADLLVYPTYLALDAAYATYADMLSGHTIGS